MTSPLVEKEREALDLMNSGKKKQAAELFLAIVKEQPDWEHGGAFYDLAGCYEDLGELTNAEESYRHAIDYGPENPYFWGGYASFLYLHGSPQDAFEAYLKLLNLERANDPNADVGSTESALRSLATKLGMDQADLASRLK